jgi:predicted lipoprotein
MLKYICTCAALLFLLNGCKPKDGGDKFDRAGMLTNLGNNVIVPAHQQFNIAAAALKTKKNSFIGNPSSLTLDSLKASFLSAYTAYMKVETYSFTASGEMRNLNVFVTDTTQINTNISTGTYNLTAANNIQAKGFPAIDYLLFGRSSNDIINLFTTDVNAAKRIQYLNDITNEIETVAGNVASSWNSSLTQFTSASGTDVGSSVGMLVNDLSFEMERCRRERVGNSLGYIGFISSGNIAPYLVEAYHSVYSKELLAENLRQLKTLYEGGSGSGFDDYLTYLNAEYNGQPLAPAISNQFDLVIQKTEAIPVGFSTALTTNKPEMESLFLELKKLTVMLKVDMSSQLGVIINYSDNDGD